MNLRSGPGTDYRIIAKLQRGTQRKVVGEENDWYRVTTPGGSTGWIHSDYLRVGSAGGSGGGAPDGVTANIIDEGVNLREGPDTSSESLGRFGAEVQVQVLALSEGWYQVRSPRGTVGWVSAEYAVLDEIASHLMQPEGDAPVEAGAGSPNQDAVRIAEQFEGAPYIWGGDTLSGFDCSGFTQYVYRQVGVSLPRKASRQYSTRYGEKIRKISDLLPGDLVFFERTTSEEGITHTGIYVGGGTIIAARSERLGVRYVSLYEPFWNSRYVGAIRPER